MNPLALQVLIVVSSVPESWLEPSLPRWALAPDDDPSTDRQPSSETSRPAADTEPPRREP